MILNRWGRGHLIKAVLTTVLAATALLLGACQPSILDSPRLATLSASVTPAPLASRSPIFSEAPSPTAGSPALVSNGEQLDLTDSQDHLTLWVNETSQSHSEAMQQIASGFTSASGIQLEYVMVSPQLLPRLMQQAVISGTLPDLVVHPVVYSAGWAENGILNPDIATQAIEGLDPGTFTPGALDSVRLGDGTYASVPGYGWRYLLLYRADLFSELGLEPPVEFSALLAAAEAIYEPESPISGIVVPTDSSLSSTQQIFEFLASANGCELVDDDGRIALLHPACLEALEFYRLLINSYSPIGFQTDISALNAYLSGRTGMIISSPMVLPIVAGLDSDIKPICPLCSEPDYLFMNTGIVNQLTGSGQYAEPATFSELTALGFTSEAPEEPALAFANYWFNEGYESWLRINPERKVPLRSGTQSDPVRFIDAWKEYPLIEGGPTLADLFGSGIYDLLSTGIVHSSRWGFDEGQGRVMTILYQDPLLSPLLQEMLSGYFNSSQSIVEMYITMINAIPGYEHPQEVMPTATPE